MKTMICLCRHHRGEHYTYGLKLCTLCPCPGLRLAHHQPAAQQQKKPNTKRTDNEGNIIARFRYGKQIT